MKFMNYFKKSLKIILLASVVMIGTFNLEASAFKIPVYLDHNVIELSNDIFIENNRTMVPLRTICESLGYNVSWDEISRTIIVKKPEQIPYVKFKIDSLDVETLDGQNTMEVTPKIIEGRTYIPLRVLVELLGEDITWDENSKSIYISSKNSKSPGINSYYVNLDSLSTPKIVPISGEIAVIDGYAPQIINPVGGEVKINEYFKEQLLNTLNSMKDTKENHTADLAEDFSGNLYYEIKNDKNNILSVSSNGSIGHVEPAAGLKGYLDYYHFYDTFYKDTGKRLEIYDILKGTKEDIQQIVDNTCGTNMGIKDNYGPYDLDEINEIDRYQLDNYNFYVQNDNLVFVITKQVHLYEYIAIFELNILDNANLFQDSFLKNYGYNTH